MGYQRTTMLVLDGGSSICVFSIFHMHSGMNTVPYWPELSADALQPSTMRWWCNLSKLCDLKKLELLIENTLNFPCQLSFDFTFSQEMRKKKRHIFSQPN